MAELRERPLDEVLAPALDEGEAARVWRRIRDAQAERRLAPRRWRYAVVTGLAVTAAALLLLAWPSRPAPRGLRGGDAALTPGAQLDATAARAIALDDGSRVTLEPDARLEVLANQGDKFVTAVRRGRVGFDVRPGGPRRWEIETDLATVEVVGTAFTVERSAAGVEVSVERGVVLVRGERVPGRVVRLIAGQRIALPAPVAVPAPAIAPAPIAVTIAPADVAPVASAPMPSAPMASASVSRVPRATAPVGVQPPADGAAVITRADELVAAGQPDDAADALAAYLRDAPDGAAAGLAAFLLGRLAQDSLGQPDRAAAAFTRVLAIGSPRAIQEEALARQARALVAAGRADDGAASARRYLARYPGGPQAEAMSALASP